MNVWDQVQEIGRAMKAEVATAANYLEKAKLDPDFAGFEIAEVASASPEELRADDDRRSSARATRGTRAESNEARRQTT